MDDELMFPAIGEYFVCNCTYLKDLVIGVNKLIQEGWQPHGTITIEPVMKSFLQVMVRYE